MQKKKSPFPLLSKNNSLDLFCPSCLTRGTERNLTELKSPQWEVIYFNMTCLIKDSISCSYKSSKTPRKRKLMRMGNHMRMSTMCVTLSIVNEQSARNIQRTLSKSRPSSFATHNIWGITEYICHPSTILSSELHNIGQLLKQNWFFVWIVA